MPTQPSSQTPSDVQIIPGSSRLTPNCGNLRMQFDAMVNGVLIRRCRYIDNEDGRASWASPPVETWTDETGKRRYRPLCEFPPEGKPHLLARARAEYERLRNGGQG